MNLFFNGFIVAYLLFFNLAICPLLVPSFSMHILHYYFYEILLMKY